MEENEATSRPYDSLRCLFSFGRAMAVMSTTTCPKNDVQLSVSQSVRMWMFGVDHVTGNNRRNTHSVVNKCTYYCFEL